MADGASDYDDDTRDGMLFRFWIRMASWPGGSPMKLCGAILKCKSPADYRKALTELAIAEGVNLP